ncbi:hypothetical protein DWU98_16750 [Dyella monticola]|uniref:Uncharacterized protein n=1 Tax=Dyella monticola TaxID=1927958 RepID=A0A370WU97_9GAMM|nr:DUF5996 family protein [Dyella monticola]RDS79713.1 hypothetical protein DWU98_16750 [Dyella monticola]
MPISRNLFSDPWPPLAYPDFAATQYLLQMSLQALGKLKLKEAFQPQWSGVLLWISAQGLTTGPIAYAGGAYEVRVDLIAHEVECVTSAGFSKRFGLASMSVAAFVESLFDLLRAGGVNVSINQNPQEVSHPIPFNEDKARRDYAPTLANHWWRILLSTQRVLHVFQGRFCGKTQPIGLMWGTLDIRSALYNGKSASPGANADYIRRNAMNAELIEMGWWSGTADYPRAAFYSFTHPQPAAIENAPIRPAKAQWSATMREFVFDYDDLRKSKDPDGDLLSFFQSTYAAGAACAGWDPNLMGTGRPD